MCWAMPSSSDNSPIVFKAPGSLSPAATRRSALGDPVAHDLAGAERHHAPRCDRHFDAGLRIAADSLTLVAEDERAETRKLDVLSLGKRVTHVMKNTLDDAGRLGTRQAQSAMHDVGKVSTRQRIRGVHLIGDPRNAEICHHSLPA